MPLRRVLEEPASTTRGLEVRFRGLDRGVEGGEAQLLERSLPLEDAMRDEVLLAYAMNGAPSRPSTAFRCGSWSRAGTA